MFSSSVSRLFSAAKGTAAVQGMQHKDGRRAHRAHDEKLDMRSLGIKYRTQSKVKLAVSGLLNPREGVIWLFCSSTCASYCCHTSNYKLIGLKMQKKKKRKKSAPHFLPDFAQAKGSQWVKIIIWFSAALVFPCGLSLDPGLLMPVFTCIWFVFSSSQTA